MGSRCLRKATILVLFALLACSVGVGAASAQASVYSSTVDDMLGVWHDRLERSTATYGESDAFQGAQDHFSRGAILLTRNATTVAVQEMTIAAAALETGRAQATAEGQQDRDKAIRDAALHLADDARSSIASLKDRLDEAVDAGMTMQELDYSVLAGYTLLLAEDRLGMHETALRGWDAGERGDAGERSLVGNAGAAVFLAEVSSGVWTNGSQAASSEGTVLDRAALSELAHARAEHARQTALEMAHTNRERVDTLAKEGKPVLAMAAFSLWAQDVTFTEQQTREEDASADRFLIEEAPKVEAWIEALGVAGDLPLSAIEGARLTSGGNASNADRAFAASLVVLSVEHVGLLVDGYTGVDHELGTSLPEVPENGWSPWTVWMGGFAIVAALLIGVAFWVKKQRTD